MHMSSMFRAVVVVLTLGGSLAALPAASASASSEHGDGGSYLALGDSVPFGYNPLLVAPGVNPDVFVGYPELAAERTRPELDLVNAACPGETSTSLITGTRPDNGCQDYRQFVGGLHVAYPASQLAFATNWVGTHRHTRLVTLMIGANDLFVLQHQCDTSPDPNCITAGLPGVLGTIAANLTTIYGALRHAGYHGTLMAVTYYSLNYADPSATAVTTSLDAVLATVTRAFGGVVADGFGELQRAAARAGGDTCAAGLLIRLSATTCDVHPTPAGARRLADAVVDAIGDHR